MSTLLPKALQAVIDEFAHLSGVGPRTAERYAYGLFKADPRVSSQLARALQSLHGGVKLCPKTFALIDADETVSSLYSDESRDKQMVAVVEDPLDVIAIEKTRQFKGTYHVLGGAISPIDGIEPEQLHVNELLARIYDDGVREVILATNASVEGETTALYVQRQIEEAGLKVEVSRLARGLPVGVDLEYADHITLKHALEGRKRLQ
ncbi:recombination protein RecR [Candidatus Saccharibacteria bacterium]|nr:recombination protein RecR [Candidatus Saccharibacteria bacterium]